MTLAVILAWIQANPWVLLALLGLPFFKPYIQKLKDLVAKVKGQPGGDELLNALNAWLKAKGFPPVPTVLEAKAEHIAELRNALKALGDEKLVQIEEKRDKLAFPPQ
jgi:hypothetical protein